MAAKPEPKTTPRGKPPRRRAPIVGQKTEVLNIERRKSGEVTDQEDNVTHTLGTEAIINPAHVTVGVSATRNLGNYESVKVSVQVTRPHLDTDEQRERVFAEASAWVEAKVGEELAKA